MKVVDIFLRKQMAHLGQIPGDYKEQLVCVKILIWLYLALM